MRWRIFLFLLLGLSLANHLALDRLLKAAPGGRVEWLLDGRAGDARAVLLGSSAAHLGFDRALLADLLDGPVVELSVPGAAYPEQHLLLDLYLERHRAETLVFEVDTWGLSSTSYRYPFHEYLYLPHLDDPTILRHLRDHYGPWQLAAWRWLPMVKFAEFNLHLGLPTLLHQILTAEPWSPPQDHLLTASLDGDRQETVQRYDRSAVRQRGFEGILDLAARHDLEVILVLAPVHRRGIEAEPDRQEVIDFYRHQAETRDLILLEPREPLISDGSLFADPFHLNRRGAEILTREVATILGVRR